MRFLPSGQLGYAFTLGGSGIDIGEAIVEKNGIVDVTGWTQSMDFPVANAIQPISGGGRDAFLTRIDTSSNTVIESTYLGGSGDDTGNSLALAPQDMTVVSGTTTSPNFPLAGPFAESRSGPEDAFVTEISRSPTSPNAGFQATPTHGPPSLTVSFRDLSSGSIQTYAWNFGDSGVSGQKNPTHVYGALGKYTVSLTVSGALGTDTATRTDLVEVVADADFKGTPTTGIAPLSVSFTNLTGPGASSYLWSFGDGATSTATSPIHTYATAGTFTVTLTAQSVGGSDVEQKASYVKASEVMADFLAIPTVGVSPLAVTFSDLSQGPIQSYLWAFGDGATISLPSPTHSYGPSAYKASLIVSGPTQTDTAYQWIVGALQRPNGIATGPGPDPGAPPHVLAFNVVGDPNVPTDIQAYGSLHYGANVGCGDLQGSITAEILTGPGPVAVFGPQVRAFLPASSPIAKVNFYAYGTLRYGVAAIGASVDADAFDEILTGAGPGAVFGPHVRGWNYDGVAVGALPGLSFYAFATLRYGVLVGSGELSSSGAQEILAAPGPGPVFGAQARGFRYGPPAMAMPKINFFGLSPSGHGARVASADIDADGFDEILVSPGPDPSWAAVVSGFDYDDASVLPTPGVYQVKPFTTSLYGAEPRGGDLDGDGIDEVLICRGADPAGASETAGFDYTPASGVVTPLSYVDFVAYPGSSYGLHAAVGDFGF